MVTIIEPGRVTPLLTIHSSNFLHFYQRGLWWKQHGDEQQPGPMPDSYLVECLEIWVARGWFDQSPQPKVNERRQEALELSLGFAIGMVHSGIIALDGEIWPGVYTLVTIIDQEFARGYQIGREWYLHEATPETLPLRPAIRVF